MTSDGEKRTCQGLFKDWRILIKMSLALVYSAAAWSAWTMTQRRELLRLLFTGIAVKHVGYRNGPRVDPGRLLITWAR